MVAVETAAAADMFIIHTVHTHSVVNVLQAALSLRFCEVKHQHAAVLRSKTFHH